MLDSVTISAGSKSMILAGMACLLLVGCRQQEQAVAAHAAGAEERAQAAATLRDEQRAQLGHVPVPTKSRYVDVHEPGAWSNPFLSFDAKMVNLRVVFADPNPSKIGEGGMLRPSAARREELQIAPDKLVEALIALPEAAVALWPRGGD